MPHAEVLPETLGNARRMRKVMTEAEAKLGNDLPHKGGDAREGRGGYAPPSTPACPS